MPVVVVIALGSGADLAAADPARVRGPRRVDVALTGSPVSVVVSDAADQAGAGPYRFFEFALAGIPLLIGTL